MSTRLLIDAQIEMDIDSYDGELDNGSELTIMRIDVFNESFTAVHMDAKEARRLGKRMIKWSDQHDRALVRAKVRSKKIRVSGSE